MAWVEDTSKRNQKAKHFHDTSTGQWRAELTIHDRHYEDENSQWQDVDETLTDDTGGFDKKCDKTRHIFQIASGGNRRWYPRRNVPTEYVDITGIQYYTNQWRNLNLPAAVWKSNGAEWDMTNLYASITNIWYRIKTYFILKDATAYTRLRFAISFTGLTYNSTTGELTSTTDSSICGNIDKPVAWYGNINRALGTNVPVTQSYNAGYIEWSVNTTGVTFPVYVDPTFSDGFEGDVNTACDTEINNASWAVNANFGTAEWMATSPESEGQIIRSLVKFNVSSLAGATATSASLIFYTNNPSIASGINIYSILAANSGWTELGATWNHAVHDTVEWAGGENGCGISGTDHNATPIGALPAGLHNASDPINIILTITQVQDWLDSGHYGMILEEGGYSVGLCTSDYTTSGCRPSLMIEYTEAPTNILGSASWGQATGAQEGNIRTFSGNWTGTGIITGSGDSEKILLSSGNYMQSEIVNTGSNSITLLQNKYTAGDSGTLRYRSGSTVTNCEAAEWQAYSGSFASTGYAQIRVEST